MLNQSALKELTPVYEAEAARFLVKLLEAGPKARGEPLANLLLSWILSVQCLGLCGKRPDNLGGDLEDIQQLRYAQQDWISLITPGQGDVYPPLRILPKFLAPWKAKALRVREGIIARVDNMVGAAKEQRAALDAGSNAWESLMAKMLREASNEKDPFFTHERHRHDRCYDPISRDGHVNCCNLGNFDDVCKMAEDPATRQRRGASVDRRRSTKWGSPSELEVLGSVFPRGMYIAILAISSTLIHRPTVPPLASSCPTGGCPCHFPRRHV